MTPQSAAPLPTAQKLAAIYGRTLDIPVVYTQGVALSGRLRLHDLTGESDPPTDVERIVEPALETGMSMFGENAGTANYAGVCWADELWRGSGNDRYRLLLLEVADFYETAPAGAQFAPPLDADIRVEDFFFAGTTLGRAFLLSRDERYLDILTRFLGAADTLQENGLWWHCRSSPFFWGRGNAFAAMGFAETLSYLPASHPSRPGLLEIHMRHLEALRSFQDETGMWRQVIDDPDSYLEHSATSMIGYSIARGVRKGWLDGEWSSVAQAAWRGVSSRIGHGGELEHVCVGTGPLPARDDYMRRPYTDGRDDRGGSMALWFAVEMARLEAGA